MLRRKERKGGGEEGVGLVITVYRTHTQGNSSTTIIIVPLPPAPRNEGKNEKREKETSII